jgi:hypothetical protein
MIMASLKPACTSVRQLYSWDELFILHCPGYSLVSVLSAAH